MKKENGVLTEVTEEDIKLLKSNPNKFWEGVSTIGEYAFSTCSKLSEIVIPESVTSIGRFAFSGCIGLSEIVIPEGVKSIEDSVFQGCQNLRKVVIPKSVTSIGKNAFYYCRSLSEIVIPEGVKSIEDRVFQRCENLRKMVIPEGVTSIGEYAFSNCSELSEIVIPEGVRSIGGFAFSVCIGLSEIGIPESVTDIGKYAFAYCTGLSKMVIPEGVKSIGKYAFGDCIGLSKIVIPEGVTSIGENAFVRCGNAKLFIRVLKVKPVLIDEYQKILDHPEKYKNFLTNNIPQRIVDELDEENKLQLIQSLEAYKKNVYNKYISGNENIDESDYAHKDLVALCLSLGIFSTQKMKLQKGAEEPVANQGYNILQKLFKEVPPEDVHRHFQALKYEAPNEEFIRFLSNKVNLNNIIQEEKSNPGFITRTISWFNERSSLQLEPTSEENRYKVAVYETTPSGVDKFRWRTPTVENLKKEFASKKFTGVNEQNAHIAEELGNQLLYEQRHFEKALEINAERESSGVGDHLTTTQVKQTVDRAWMEYFHQTERKRNEIVGELTTAVKEQGEVADRIFTYEMLSKSSPANFCMGFYTSCCATLYGAGSGAQRAMIVSPDMQPLAIRDSRGTIVAFGIIYVNRKEGYAVVNDFEVNKMYEGRDDIREAIYNKAMAGVDAFVNQYNHDQEESRRSDTTSKKIRKVTCGISPNWDAINDFIEKNPKSEILSAPDLGSFGYVGQAGRWPGDWHRSQYIIWEEGDNGRNV